MMQRFWSVLAVNLGKRAGLVSAMASNGNREILHPARAEK